MIWPGAALAQTEPSLVIGDAPAVTTGNAWTYFNGLNLTSPIRAADPLIERTASALGDDPTRIFAFVYNEIEVVPMFGVQKGARGCLIDKACTPFDQAHLLAELLRAAGYSPVYRFGEITGLTLTQMGDWLGVSNVTALNDILADGGIPFSTSGGGGSTTYALLHMWVEVTVGGQLRRLDPSFKSHTVISGIANLDAVMGFSAATFMSTGSGGALSGSSSSATGAPQVATFNRNNVRSSLQTYSVNLLNDIRANHADDAIKDIVGGRDIAPVTPGSLPTALPYSVSGAPLTFNNDVPVVLRTQTTVTVTVNDVFNWTLDEIYGEEFALIPMQIFPQQGSPDPIQYRFHRSSQPITPWRIGASGALSVAFNHPYAANGGAYLDRTLSGSGEFNAGGIQFVIGAGAMTPDFGAYIEARSSPEEGWVSVQPTGFEPGDPVVTNAQHATKRRYAVSFATQFSSALDMAAELGDATVVVHDMLVVARTVPIIGGENFTPVTSIASLSTQGAISANSNSANAGQTQAQRRAAGALMGVLEGSAIEQNLDSVNSVSTARRFDWFSNSSENAAADRRFYFANTANKAYVESQILANGYYGDPDSWNLAESYIDAGYTVIVPRSSSLGPGVAEVSVCSAAFMLCDFPGPERGTAIVAISPAGVAHVITAQIESLKGGAGTNDAESNPARIFSIPEDFLERQFTSRAEAYNVDMATGVVTYTPPPDLVVGEGAYPYSLSFQRSYRSGAGYQRDFANPQPVGQTWAERFGDTGWTSNWMAEARVENDGQRGYGEQSPREATDTIVAIRVLLALSADQSSDLATLQYQLGAIHAMAWWSEQLTYNSIQIVEGANNRSFFKLADGAYQGQPGDPTQITVQGDRYTPAPHPVYDAPLWYYNRMCVTALNGDGSTSYYGTWNGSFTSCVMTANPTTNRGVMWMRFRRQSFREGVVVSFDDTTLSNNLGRSISLLNTFPNYTVRDDGAQSRTVAINIDAATGPGTMSVTGTDGNTWVYNGASDSSWRVFAPSSSSNPAVTFDYVWTLCGTPPCNPDSRVRGQVERLTDAVGNDAQYYVSTGRISAMVDPLGNATRTYYDEHSQPIRVTNRLGHDTLTEYDNFRRVRRVTYPEGNGEEYEYNLWHARTLVRRLPKPGSSETPIETETSYATTEATFFSTCGMPLTETDGNNNVTAYTLLTNRCLISTVTQPAVDDGTDSSSNLVPPETNYTWNGFGQLLTRTDPTGRLVTNAYAPASGQSGPSNYLYVVTVDNGSDPDIVTKFSRNAAGDITSVTDPRNNAHTGTYDASRRLTRYDGPSGTNAATEWRYNADGLVDRVRQATGQSSPNDWSTTTYVYLPTGRPQRVTDPDGGITQYSYDALNRPDCVAVRMNPSVYASQITNATPISACALSTQGSAGPDRISRTEYDAEGHVRFERRGYGTPSIQLYATRTWTNNGQLDTVMDANGNRSNLDYDDFDRLKRLYFPDGTLGSGVASTTDYEQYGYDNNDNRISIRLRSTETIGYHYDALNRECFKDLPSLTSSDPDDCGASVTGAAGGDVFTTYDLAGRRTLVRFPSSLTPSATCTAAGNPGIDYCYDAVGRLQYETSHGRRLGFSYDPASNRTRITFPVMASEAALYLQYDYDALNRVTAVRENGAASGLGELATYGYDAMSRRTSMQRGDAQTQMPSTSYGYSPASRLTTLNQNLDGSSNDANWAFSYNVAGQTTLRSQIAAYEWAVLALDEDYQRNGLNQYTSVESVSFTHDARGNLRNDGARSLCYDLENRLIAVDAAADTNCPTPTATFAYDPLGRLRQSAAGGVTTDFLYDGDRLVAEYNGTTLLRRYAHGAGVDEPIVWYQGTTLTDRRWLIADRQGSIIAAIDGAGALVGSRYRYSPYGEPDAGNAWNTSASRFRYTGQIALPEAQLYYYKARVYDPGIGRFVQTDPVGYQGGLSLYAYVGNDPVNRSDPTGLYPIQLQFLSNRSITAEIGDALRPEQQALAEQTLQSAAALTLSMEAAGTLPQSSIDATNALGSMSVSNAISGYTISSGNYNVNIAELTQSAVNQAGHENALAAQVAGDTMHDSTHALQAAAGQLPAQNFTVNTPSFDAAVISTERAAIDVQTEFLNAAPISEGVRNNLTGSINGQTDEQILNRYYNRQPSH